MTFYRTSFPNKKYEYITKRSDLDGLYVLSTPTSPNKYFEKGTRIEIGSSGTEMTILGGAKPQKVKMSLGTHCGQPCWLFGSGDDNSLFVAYLRVDKTTHGTRIVDFERFNLGGGKLHELPWAANQITHAQQCPPAVMLNQDDEGSGEEP